MPLDLDQAVTYHTGKFPPATVAYEAIVEALLQAENAIARYDQELSSLHNKELFLAPLRNQEAVLSSRMEGTISTVDEILKYETSGDDEAHNISQNFSQNTSNVRPDIIETILYRRALNYAQQEMEGGRELSSSLIRSMHQMLLSLGRGAGKDPGQFKTEQNYIGDKRSGVVSYIPVSPEHLPEGLETLFAYIKSSGHPQLIRTAFAHLEFEALHPFKDGNGRIGRMLITLMLWSGGVIASPHFYISRYMEEHKEAYIARMRNVSANNEWTEWLLFFLQAIKEQARYNLAATQSIRALYDDMKSVFSDITGSKHAIALLDAVFTHPVFRSRQIIQQSGIPAATVTRFIRLLQHSEGDLIRTVQAGAGRRPAIYAFEPLLKLIRV